MEGSLTSGKAAWTSGKRSKGVVGGWPTVARVQGRHFTQIANEESQLVSYAPDSIIQRS